MKILVTLAGGAFFFFSWPAAANGRFPLANQIVFSPTDPQLIVLRTSYGILPSHDNGKTWNYLCEEAIGVGPSTLADPTIGLTRNNSLLAGVSAGLNVSSDVGCNWSCMSGSLTGQVVTDLAVRPDSPNSAVAITGSPFVQADSGLTLSQSQVFETTDDGVSWAPLGVPIDPDVVVTTVDVTKTDPDRLYASGTRGFGAARTASLFVSKDKGQSWTEWPFPAAQFDRTTEDAIFIGGVDPTNADRLYIRSSGLVTVRSSGLVTGGRSRLTVVTLAADGTPTFETAHLFDVEAGFLGLTGEMLGFALSPDGSKIYIGSNGDGLLVAEASNLVFRQQNSKIHVQCLATRGAELWACAPAMDGFVAGVSMDEGKTFTPKLPLIGALAGPVACEPNGARAACGEDANASQCGPYYDAFCSTYTCPAPDASLSGDASANSVTSNSASGPASSSSCDVAVVGGGGAAGLGAALSLAGVALRRRRRRR